jgi:Family of unknown function (DUF5719)
MADVPGASGHHQGPGAAAPLHRSGAAARIPLVAVLAAALIAGVFVDRGSGSTQPASAAAGQPASGQPASGQPVPVAAPVQALSSSWFCAGATDAHLRTSRARGAAPGWVVIANSAPRPATGVVTLIPSTGPSVSIPVSVKADSQTTVTENVPAGAAWIGAVVDMDSGGIAVDQQLHGAFGQVSTPCATAGSSQWYFATGATLINAGVEISLLNPYPSDAVVDMSFTTSEGLEQPQALQAILVPADSLVPVNLGSQMRRRQAIATSIVARSGRVVAWKTDVVTPPAPGATLLGTAAASAPLADPASPIPGVTLTLGVSAPATEWTWADGETGNGLDEQYVIYNPGPDTAQLTLAVDLAQGLAEPFSLSVGPYQVNAVVSSAEVRIPPGVAHAAVLRSTNGVPVVAERTLAARAPSTWSGLGELPGGLVAADRWLIPVVTADSSHAAWVVLYNPGSVTARVILGALDGRGDVPMGGVTVLGPGRRLAIHINSLGPVIHYPLVVAASEPVYAEADYYGWAGARGISLSFGVPFTSAAAGA